MHKKSHHYHQQKERVTQKIKAIMSKKKNSRDTNIYRDKHNRRPFGILFIHLSYIYATLSYSTFFKSNQIFKIKKITYAYFFWFP